MGGVGKAGCFLSGKVKDLIVKLVGTAVELCQLTAHFKLISETDGIFIVCFNREDRRNYATFFYFVERAAKLFHKVNTGFLKPADVVGMVDYIHAVCFIIKGFSFVGGKCHFMFYFL